MVRSLIEMRALAAMVVAAAVGVWGLTAFPMSRDNPFTSERARRELGWDPPVRPEAGVPDAFSACAIAFDSAVG